ncbi:MAG: class I adenylate-forming enzyme family protein [Bacillota bacterium]
MENLCCLLERNARKLSGEKALIHPASGREWTWQQLAERVEALARELVGRGLVADDRVGIYLNNTPEFIVALFGAWQAGTAVVPINPKMTAAEASYLLQDSGAAGLVYADALQAQVDQLDPAIKLKVALPASRLEQLSRPEAPVELPGKAQSAEAVAEIIYTSGTTGRPKGVVLTHDAVYHTANMFMYETSVRRHQKMLILMPLTHSAPLNLSLLAAVMAGATIILGDYMPADFLRWAESYQIDHFFGAPVAYLLPLTLPEFQQTRLPVATWCHGGAPLGKEKVELLMAKYPGNIASLYGLTEAGPNGVALMGEEHRQHPGSIGRLGTVNAEIRVISEAGAAVQPGEVGEIIIKTPTAMRKYLNNPEATAETLRDGWVYTGDLGYVDEEGYIFVLDRKKDMIITGGVNVYPKEIEDTLAQLPQVLEAAVFGVPHPDWGETVCAAIVLKPGQQLSQAEVVQFCRQLLAEYKVPRKLEFVEVLPRNANGKVLKKVLKEMM